VTHVFAETVYYSNGLLYTYINNENVSIYGAEEGTVEIDIPEYINNRKVVAIRNNAFMENADIVSINLSDASFLKSIGSFSFAYCNALSGVLVLPELLTSIGTAAFQGCSSLQSIIYDAQTGIVPNQCFSGCTALSSVTLNDTVTEIGFYAFSNCPNLTYIEIPKSVTSIAKSSFQNDTDITLGVYRNSYALEYAENNGIKYVILDPEPTEPPTEPSTEAPTVAPTDAPTEPITPTDAPTEEPTAEPTQQPTQPVTEAPTEAAVFILGDANGDNSVDVTDATIMQRYLANMHYIDEKVIMHGDIDGDGEISIQDVTFTLRYLASIEVPYPIDQPIKK
jgi:hypothetical protein